MPLSQQAVFLPEASDFIARSSSETVKITQDARPIDKNEFVEGLQDQAVSRFQVAFTSEPIPSPMYPSPSNTMHYVKSKKAYRR